MRAANFASVLAVSGLLAPMAFAESWSELPDSCEPIARMHFPNCAVWQFAQCSGQGDVAWVETVFFRGQIFALQDYDVDGNVVAMPRMGDWTDDTVIEHADRLDFALFLETGEEEISHSFGNTEMRASLTWDQGYRFQTELPVNRADFIGSMIIDGETHSFDDSAYFFSDIPIFVGRSVPPILVQRAEDQGGFAELPECLES